LKTPRETLIMTGFRAREAPLSEVEPIQFSPRTHAGLAVKTAALQNPQSTLTTFDRRELNDILALYGRKVAAGEWRDYAIDFGREKAVFSVFRRSSEVPLYRIEKNPRLARRQGAYSVIAATGLILKRGHDLARVLGVLEKNIRLAAV
jgi:Protein of unknown function (DUF2794)